MRVGAAFSSSTATSRIGSSWLHNKVLRKLRGTDSCDIVLPAGLGADTMTTEGSPVPLRLSATHTYDAGFSEGQIATVASDCSAFTKLIPSPSRAPPKPVLIIS